MLKLEQSKLTKIKKRNGQTVEFDTDKIKNAIRKAFVASNVNNEFVLEKLAREVINVLESKFGEENIPTVENVQDVVETVLILNNYAQIAKSYMIYRQKRTEQRQQKAIEDINAKKIYIINEKSEKELFDVNKLLNKLQRLGGDLEHISIKKLLEDICKLIYADMPLAEIDTLILNAVKTRIEKHYDYSYLASRLLLDQLYRSVLSEGMFTHNLNQVYQNNFKNYIET